MWLETTCENITIDKWNQLMKGAKPLSYKWLVAKIKKELPDVYTDLQLNLFNPYWKQCYTTKTHYVLTHSSIEYFFNKGENWGKNVYLNEEQFKNYIKYLRKRNK